MSVPNLKRIALFFQKLLGDVRRKSNDVGSHPPPVYLTPPMKGLPLEFGIGVKGPECFYDGAIRWSKKFSDTFSRFDTILAVTDSHPPSQPASHVAVAITLNAKASSPKIVKIGEQKPKILQNKKWHSSFWNKVYMTVFKHMLCSISSNTANGPTSRCHTACSHCITRPIA